MIQILLVPFGATILLVTACTSGSTLNKTQQIPNTKTTDLCLSSVQFAIAPGSSLLNLCNIHTHTNAEHKGPDFSIFVGNDEHGGFACNETASLTQEQLRDPVDGAFKSVKPGDTLEVHWVHSSCAITQGESLSSCLSDTCSSPMLRATRH